MRSLFQTRISFVSANRLRACCPFFIISLLYFFQCTFFLLGLCLDPFSIVCCSGSVYNPSFQIYCDGKPHSKIGLQQPACCRSYPYDANNTLCCNSSVYDIDTHLCCEGRPAPRVGNYLACCGSTAYDVQNQLCCENQVVPKVSPYSACCASQGQVIFSYNTLTQLCCEGFVYPRAPGVQCCGSLMYNTMTYMCCDGSLILPKLITGCAGFA